MKEKIGQITLDYKHYPGADYYCDGQVEDELLQIVQNNPPCDFQKIIEERANWPVLYHLSPLRENIISWLPVDKTMKVLEVGSGCGAITGVLARCAGSVTCIDLSKKRSYINAYRHQDCGNVTIHVGNFKDIEPDMPCDFDYIFLIGAFEYAQGYMGTPKPYEDMMAILKKHLKKDDTGEGRLVIAIENKFGLKYWAGCPEDHSGRFFDGIEDYPHGGGARTFTRSGLEKICQSAGIGEYTFYYPYPDYKFMSMLYSDKRLPMTGELSLNLRNYDRPRLLLFDEKSAFDAILREGQFPLYANSYLLVTGKAPELIYTKYSNDRAAQFAIRTDIVETQKKERQIRKHPMTEMAKAHTDSILRWHGLLCARYEGGSLHINECRRQGGALCFSYIEGKTLESALDECLDNGDKEGFAAMLLQFLEIVSYQSQGSAPVTDCDIVFSNILIKNNEWYLIDYEWTKEEDVPASWLLLRALYFYIISSEKRRKLKDDPILQSFGLNQETFDKMDESEKRFQQYVTGNRLSMVQMRDAIGEPMLATQEIEAQNFGKSGSRDYSVQVYMDTGAGFCEETSYFLPGAYKNAHCIEVSLEAAAQTQHVRIDPAMASCLVMVREFTWNGRKIPMGACSLPGRNYVRTNGIWLGKNSILFATQDPQIVLCTKHLAHKASNTLRAAFEIARIPQEAALCMIQAANGQKGEEKEWK